MKKNPRQFNFVMSERLYDEYSSLVAEMQQYSSRITRTSILIEFLEWLIEKRKQFKGDPKEFFKIYKKFLEKV